MKTIIVVTRALAKYTIQEYDAVALIGDMSMSERRKSIEAFNNDVDTMVITQVSRQVIELSMSI